MSPRTSSVAALSVAGALVLWACAFPAIKVALRTLDAPQLASMRFLGGSAVLLTWGALRRPTAPRVARASFPPLALTGILGFVAYHVALNGGEQSISAGAAGFLIATVPLFTLLIAALTIREQLSPRACGGLALGLLGAAIIAGGQGRIANAGPGAALVLLASLSEAVMFVIQKPLLRRYKPLQCTTYALVTATVCMLPWIPGATAAMISQASAAVIASVVYLACLPTALAYVLWAQALAKLPASVTAATLYAMPALASVTSWLLLGEVPAITTVGGGSLAMLGVWVAHRRSVERDGCRGRSPALAVNQGQQRASTPEGGARRLTPTSPPTPENPPNYSAPAWAATWR